MSSNGNTRRTWRSLAMALAALALVAAAAHAGHDEDAEAVARAGAAPAPSRDDPDGYQPRLHAATAAGLPRGLVPARTGESSGRPLRLLDVAGAFELVDVGRPAESEDDVSPGDTFIFENELRDSEDSMNVGEFFSACTALATPGRVLCSGTLSLPGGTIELSTSADLAAGGEIVASVNGGTGRYARARGQIMLGEEVRAGVRSLTIELAR